MPPAAGHATRTFPICSRPATDVGCEFGPVDLDSCLSACTSREAMRGCTACVGCASVTTLTNSSHPERMPQGCRGGCGLSAADCANATARTELGAHALMLGVTRRHRQHPTSTVPHCLVVLKFRLRHGQRLCGLQQPLQHPCANASRLGQDGRARLRHDVPQRVLELGGGDYLGRYLGVPAPCRPCARATAASRIEIRVESRRSLASKWHFRSEYGICAL